MDTAMLDKQVQAMEWLRSDAIGIDQVQQSCDSWDPLVRQLSSFALCRYGRKNNNWLKIIPLMMHEMAGQISECVSSMHDVETKVDGQPEWQDTFWRWFDAEEHEEQQTPGDDVDIDKLSAEAIGTRLKQMHEDAEWMDPFYIEDMKRYEESRAQKQVDKGAKPDVDEDLLM